MSSSSKGAQKPRPKRKSLAEDYNGSIGEDLLEYMATDEAAGGVQQSADSVGASSNLSRRIQNRLQKLNEVAQQTAGGEGSAAGAAAGAGYYDFSTLELKPDHDARPVWVCPNGRLFLEAFSPIYKQAYDFLVAIAEPVSRPEFVHEYKLTPYSLYAAVSVAIETESILKVLERLAKNRVPPGIVAFIQECTLSYGKAKLVLHHNEFYVESLYPDVLRKLLEHEHIRAARVKEATEAVAPGASQAEAASEFIQKDVSAEDQANLQYQKLLNEDYTMADDQESDKTMGAQQKTVRTVSFKIRKKMVEQVKRACLDLDYPLMEEYDFRNDKMIPDLEMDLKPSTRIREYQEKSLSKMFGNGRARSGIIVLPCGAGKTLTGVTAASTIKKSCLCLCTSAVSVEQWTAQFKMWTNISEKKIARFTSVAKDYIDPDSGVIVTTYTMVAFGGRRARASEEVMQLIQGREWGCILLDEVHVVPAKMFRKVIGSIACHCKLGLTATLVREDDLIGDLNFLIGPKLYEANWMDLTQSGFLANVSCVEVWCPMAGEFYREYLRETKSARKRALLYVANPNKFTAAEFLIQYHEERGDKILLFSDDVFALRLYATKLNKGYIYGGTGERERMRLLQSFRSSPLVNVICISKVGDTSIDLPEANVIIQVSSHFGSRRQEAQRLGRILRPKANATGGFNAFFYTLISTDTHEMYYSNKRQQYLVDQGYTFKVVTDLFEPGSFEGVFTRKEDQRALLNEVLSADVESAAKDENAAIRDDEDLSRLELSGLGSKKKKKLGSLGALSGADGTKYMEYSAGHGAKQRHNLFRDRYR
uniref:DNA 3'-5' helicase n=1 Tax=Peronospora matthiolae TaxID=2874970 RepID=A0AAV1T4K8_9STRA